MNHFKAFKCILSAAGGERGRFLRPAAGGAVELENRLFFLITEPRPRRRCETPPPVGKKREILILN